MKLSIITTCLNSERTIRFTLNSILSQSYKDIEHIKTVNENGTRSNVLHHDN